MSILLTNDDGPSSILSWALKRKLEKFFPVKMILPERDVSGSGGALSLKKSITVRKCSSNNVYYVDGTAADAAYIGIYGGINGFEDIKMVVSGINEGSNYGDDLFSSGTFGAAVQGRFLDCMPIGISVGKIPNRGYVPDIVKMAFEVVKFFYESNFVSDGLVLNVNLPVCYDQQVRGVRTTRLGMRKPPGWCSRKKINDQFEEFTIGRQGEFNPRYKNTDWESVKEGYISITPCDINLTRHEVVSRLNFGLLDAKFAELYLKEKKS